MTAAIAPGVVVAPFLLVISALPLALYLLAIAWMDRYDREPVGLVVATVAWGAIGGAALAILFSSAAQVGIEDVLGAGSLAQAASAVLVAPVVEEATKGVALLALLLSRRFDNATDGVVYGAAAGLGFAMTENFLYGAMAYGEAGAEGLVSTAVVRTLFTAVVHACATGTLGFFVGLGRYRRSAAARWLLPPVGYAAAVALHAYWNASMAAAAIAGGGIVITALAYGALPLIAAVLIGVTQVSLLAEHRMLRRELEEEERLGWLPAGQAAILPFARRRSQGGWLPAGVHRRDYVRAATTLAFRKDQARRAPAADAAALGAEVEVLRERVAAMMSGTARLPPLAADR